MIFNSPQWFFNVFSPIDGRSVDSRSFEIDRFSMIFNQWFSMVFQPTFRQSTAGASTIDGLSFEVDRFPFGLQWFSIVFSIDFPTIDGRSVVHRRSFEIDRFLIDIQWFSMVFRRFSNNRRPERRPSTAGASKSIDFQFIFIDFQWFFDHFPTIDGWSVDRRRLELRNRLIFIWSSMMEAKRHFYPICSWIHASFASFWNRHSAAQSSVGIDVPCTKALYRGNWCAVGNDGSQCSIITYWGCWIGVGSIMFPLDHDGFSMQFKTNDNITLFHFLTVDGSVLDRCWITFFPIKNNVILTFLRWWIGAGSMLLKPMITCFQSKPM